MADTKPQMVKKHRIALFIDKSDGSSTADYIRIKKATELTLSMNPETVDYDYIADESPTTELDKYKPSINEPLTMYKGEPDFDVVFNYFYNMKVGSDAHTKALVVFMFDGDASSGFKAWETDAIITIDEMNAVESTITFNVMFNGTTRKGTATMLDGKPTFSELSTSSIPSTASFLADEDIK